LFKLLGLIFLVKDYECFHQGKCQKVEKVNPSEKIAILRWPVMYSFPRLKVGKHKEIKNQKKFYGNNLPFKPETI